MMNSPLTDDMFIAIQKERAKRQEEIGMPGFGDSGVNIKDLKLIGPISCTDPENYIVSALAVNKDGKKYELIYPLNNWGIANKNSLNTSPDCIRAAFDIENPALKELTSC